MTPQELEYWRIEAAIQELFGATDEDIKRDKDLRDAISMISKSILKWRTDARERERIELRMSLLKEIGVPVIGRKK